jgi:copper(I)-binding protein
MTTHITRTSLSSPLSRRAALLGGLALPVLGLAACGGSDDAASGSAGSGHAGSSDGGGSEGGSAGSGATPLDGKAPLTVTDPWIKAADKGMTAAFGTLTNTGKDTVTLVGAACDQAGMAQLHETVGDGSGGMSMKEKKGGFPIKAGGTLVLEPGGDHIMLMDLKEKLQPGDSVKITLTLDDDTTGTFEATVKDFAGAQENYGGGSDGGGASDGGGMDMGASDGGGMDMGGSDHDSHGDH